MDPVCLVMGAGAGIGGHVGKRFARGGYHAVLCRRSDDQGLQRLVQEIEAEGGAASGYLLDPAAPDNPSIWDAENYDFELPGLGRYTNYRIPDQPRAYLRVIPKDWPEGAPTVAEMRDANFYELPNVTLGSATTAASNSAT